ncbi:MAG: cupin domain-containing protein [Oligoflexia bacterium]|nr:cupin domain-containing protein [Oligoflexia bacterium]
MEAIEVINKLGLVPLPEEGGFYIETHRDPYSTCIYYLITPEEFSGLHAVKSAEIFHFYAGDPVEMVQINQEGELSKVILGSNISEDEKPQVIVEPLIWQGTKLLGDGKWALLGCTVSPAFQFENFITATCSELIEMFPAHQDIIENYTHS